MHGETELFNFPCCIRSSCISGASGPVDSELEDESSLTQTTPSWTAALSSGPAQCDQDSMKFRTHCKVVKGRKHYSRCLISTSALALASAQLSALELFLLEASGLAWLLTSSCCQADQLVYILYFLAAKLRARAGAVRWFRAPAHLFPSKGAGSCPAVGPGQAAVQRWTAVSALKSLHVPLHTLRKPGHWSADSNSCSCWLHFLADAAVPLLSRLPFLFAPFFILV